ncbi:MAG: glycosyltransferase family 2 protein [Bacilli bacterium]
MRKKETKKGKFLVFSVFVLCVFAIIVAKWSSGPAEVIFGVYGMIMLSYLLIKLLLSFHYKPFTGSPRPYRVSVVIPYYNEDYETVKKTVESILAQTYKAYEIFIIDDGSKDRDTYEKLRTWANAIDVKIPTTIIVHRQEPNAGKRIAQVFAFEHATGDVFFTVDSDGYIANNALYELLIPFNDPEVMAVTGHINARNREDNLFTRLLDMRYENAFRVERAAQSVTGNILVCSGPISCYRREVIVENLEHYRNQEFLGQPVQFGDDRCLTNYAILRGKTVYQSTATCITDVPSSFAQFIKQQIRWNKSFFRESLIAFGIGLKKPKVLVWVILELSLWLIFGVSISVGTYMQYDTLGLLLLAYYMFYVSISSYARNVYYILQRPFMFLLAPLYGIIHLVILFPLRFYALSTLKSNGWGTR